MQNYNNYTVQYYNYQDMWEICQIFRAKIFDLQAKYEKLCQIKYAIFNCPKYKGKHEIRVNNKKNDESTI